jgi:hypothetical protein
MKYSLIPWGAISGIVLIVVSDLMFLWWSEPLTGLKLFEPTADDAVLVAKRELARRSDDGVLIVGDSSALMGIKPAEVRKYIPCEVVNLGTLSSFTIAGYADLVINTVENGSRPRAIVLAVLPQAFSVSEEDVRRFNLLPRYLIAYRRQYDGYDLSLKEYFEWWYKKHRFNFFPGEFGGSYMAFRSVLGKSNGYYGEKQRYTGTPKGQRRKHFREDPFSIKAFCRLVSFARLEGIPLLVWISPAPVDSVDDEYIAEFNAFMASGIISNGSASVPTNGIVLWDQNRFGTVTHLRPDFATDNSRDLGIELRRVVINEH